MLYVRYFLLVIFCCFSIGVCASDRADELKLMHIGNSFSRNSTEFLPQLAEAGGKKITIFAASKGGCSLQCHVNFLQLAQQNKPDGSTYNVTRALQSYHGDRQRVSLIDALKAEQWDVITIQQGSSLSFDKNSFEPYGEMLIAQILSIAPSASIMLHKTWAYHDDHRMFKEQREGPLNHLEMHQAITDAYLQFAAKYELPLIPSADAISLAYQKVLKSEMNNGSTSDKSGVGKDIYIRRASRMLYSNDGAHLDIAGKYLTASVWYEILFDESVVDLDFVPEGLDADYARVLRELAHQVVNQQGVE